MHRRPDRLNHCNLPLATPRPPRHFGQLCLDTKVRTSRTVGIPLIKLLRNIRSVGGSFGWALVDISGWLPGKWFQVLKSRIKGLFRVRALARIGFEFQF
jgi:hypothetical protein